MPFSFLVKRKTNDYNMSLHYILTDWNRMLKALLWILATAKRNILFGKWKISGHSAYDDPWVTFVNRNYVYHKKWRLKGGH